MKLISSIAMPSWASGLKLVTSVCEGCHRSYTTRQQSDHNTGIRMQEAWYCSAACFTGAVEQLLAKVQASVSEPLPRSERMPLGLLMVSRGVLTSEQWRTVSHEHRVTGVELEALMVSQGMVSEKQIAAARAAQWGCPVFSVPARGVYGGILLPAPLVAAYQAVPLHYGSGTNQLLIGFVHGVEYGLLYAVEHMMGCKTEASMVTASDFELQRSAQPLPGPGYLLVRESIQPATATAQDICGAALDLEAHEAALVKCKGYVWARVRRNDEVRDLIFKSS